MKARSIKTLIVICTWIAIACLCAIPMSAGEVNTGVIHLPVTGWTQDTSYFNNSVFEISGDTVVIHNKGGNPWGALGGAVTGGIGGFI